MALPSEIIIYGEFTSMLVDRTYRVGTTSKTYLLPIMGGGKILTNASREENNAELYNDSLAYGGLLMIVTIILFISGIFAVDIFNNVALKQVTRMRIKYFTSTIRQDIGWHDTTKHQNIALKITDEIEKIRDGISEKISHFLILLLGFIISTGISFIYGWKLSLVISAYIPITFLINLFSSKYQSKLTTQELNCFARAGNVVEEILNGIRTVIAFGGEKCESKRYDDYLTEARKAVARKGAFTGFSWGALNGLVFLSCAVAFSYGIILILADRNSDHKEYSPAVLMIVVFGIICGAFNVGRCSPFLESFATARGTAATIFDVIDSSSNIDPLSQDGNIPNFDIKGDIDFQNVEFNYPSREDVTILKGINIRIKGGTTTALVGSSGCGKSTCIQLLQRFYDPSFGQILLDNINIKNYNTAWLRSNIAVVGQEPVLFQGTIGENIRYGKPSAAQKEIEEAAKIAGAHEFIIQLPNNYATLIAEKGTQLSGGQKQRIAIARALVQNPKILLLDEATSALDYKSEKLIQDALDAASKNRTTIVVSHRLSAIKGADKIFFIEHGNVVEEGSQEDLMKLNGRYQQMVTASQHKMTEENDIIINTRKNSVISYEQLSNFKTAKSETDDIELHQLSEFDSLTKGNNEKIDNNIRNINYFETFTRILNISQPIKGKIICAVILSFVFGSVYPTFSIFFGEFYGVLAEPDEEIALSKSRILSYIFAAIGIGVTFVCFLQMYLLASCGGWIAAKIRSLTFKSILKQDVGWFDLKENSVGSLSARLNGDAANIQGAIGSPLSDILQGVSQFILSVIAAMYFSRELTLISMALIPIMVGANVIEAKLTESTILQEKKALEEASRFSTEAIHNIRTVAALRMEKQIIAQFTEEMTRVEKILKQKLRYRGLVNSFGNSLMYFGYSVILSYGGILVSKEEISFQNVIKVAELLLFGSISFAQSLIFAPAITSALIAGHRLFEIIDHNPQITSPPLLKSEVAKNQLSEVEYQGIKFNYSTRPEIPILQGINLKVQQGKTIALVGHSGCGKSTCIQLLQRFYDPDEGEIQLNQKNIKTEMTLENLRSELGIVSQEPVLFERTIAENIAYGDNERTVPIEEIIKACIQANAHSFITTLPLGYDTPLGAWGTQLSGGQKQRIAIARALVRNPKLLLLDEATSALDIKSEKIVQAALDLACSDRTCIVIAHRLSTIQNADLICVFDHGKIMEQGTHQQLLEKNGIYSELYKLNENL